MNLDIEFQYDLLSLPNRNDNSHLFHRSNSISKINNNWSLVNEEPNTGINYGFESDTSSFTQVLDNESSRCEVGNLHKTWSTPYLNNNEENTKCEESGNEHYLNLLNASNPLSLNTLSSNVACNPYSSTSTSNSLLKDAINNNIEKSWLMSLKKSKKQMWSDGLESFRSNENELIESTNAFHSEDNQLYVDSKKSENVQERKSSSSSQPTFVLSTNLESLSPITISLTDISCGENSVSPSFPSDKLVYLDSPIRITIMGSHQVGKSALAVRYLSKQESSHRSPSRAFSSTMHGMKNKLTSTKHE